MSLSKKECALVGIGAALGFGAALLLKRMRTGRQVAGVTAAGEAKAPRRCAGLCRLKPEMYDQYTALHDHTWDEVMARMYASNMRNFVVYYHAETHQMFHHFEYVGDDFKADMAAVDADPIVRRWWSYCEPCQEPLHWEGKPPSQGGDGGEGGAWWAEMQCLNHCGGWPVAWSQSYPDPDFKPNNPGGKTTDKDHPPPVHNRPN